MAPMGSYPFAPGVNLLGMTDVGTIGAGVVECYLLRDWFLHS